MRFTNTNTSDSFFSDLSSCIVFAPPIAKQVLNGPVHIQPPKNTTSGPQCKIKQFVKFRLHIQKVLLS